MRIASLLPSATEIVYDLGFGDQLVGVTFECDFPAEARSRAAVVVGGLETADLSPPAIDALVREKIAAGEDLYQLDFDRLKQIDPEVILTQDLCRVCAVPSGQVEEALTVLDCHATVVTLDPHSLPDVLQTITTVAGALGDPAAGEVVVKALRRRLAEVRRAVAGETVRRVFVLEWTDPPFSAGHWVPELVSGAGGDPVLAHSGERSRQVGWAEMVDAEPELIIVSPCGFGVEAASAQASDVLHLLPPGVPVWAVDSNSYVVRPGPRLVDGVELFAAILHPAIFGDPPPDRARRVR